jgi:hypothetical protein
VDKEWDEMLRRYLERVPVPAFRTDPPIKTRLEEQFKQEEPDDLDDKDPDGE